MLTKKQKERLEREQLKGASLVSLMKPYSQISEQFRSLRTNMSYSMIDGNIKTMMVTSTGPYEGKSTVAVNIAVMFAQEGKRVLIVDADLRKPTLHRTFGVINHTGLTSWLAHQRDNLNDLIHVVDAANIYVLTSGPKPPNPAEMLNSKRMAELIVDLKKVFDLIIFDVPPLLSVTDAQILSTKVDGVVFVVRKGIADRRALKRAKDLLDTANATVIGAVFNGVDKTSAAYYSEYDARSYRE